MKNKLMATLAISALAAGISAAQADAHPYAGISGGYFKGNADIQDGSTSEGTGGLQLGYHFDQDWSVELGHQEGVATRDEHIRLVSLTAAYRLLGEETQLLGVAGMQNVNYDEGDVEPVLGLAVSHYFTDNVELRATVLGAVEDSEWVSSALSLNYHFGTHMEEQEPVAAAPAKAEPAVVMTKTLRVNFDTDSSTVNSADRAQIREVSDSMKNNPGSTATLVGHTDSTASDEYNQALSERRAAAVKAAMVEDGVSADAVEESGRGESEPVADNATKEGRAENRRVEATVTGIKE